MLNSTTETTNASISVYGVKFSIKDSLNAVRVKCQQLRNSDKYINDGFYMHNIENADNGSVMLSLSLYGKHFMTMYFKESQRKTARGFVKCHYLVDMYVDAMNWALGMCHGLGFAHWVVREYLSGKHEVVENNEILNRIFCMKYGRCTLLTSSKLYEKFNKLDISGSETVVKTHMMFTLKNAEPAEWRYIITVSGEVCELNQQRISKMEIKVNHLNNVCGGYIVM